jgi:hypothetical protein
MDTYIVVISEIVAGTIHFRAWHTVSLPPTGTAAAARDWLLAEVWPNLQEEYPGRTVADWRVDYIQLTELPLP